MVNYIIVQNYIIVHYIAHTFMFIGADSTRAAGKMPPVPPTPHNWDKSIIVPQYCLASATILKLLSLQKW